MLLFHKHSLFRNHKSAGAYRLLPEAVYFLFLTMFPQLFNWRTILAVVAIIIVSATIFYSNFLAKKIALEEKQKIEK